MKNRVAAALVAAFAACLVTALCGCTQAYDPNASMKDPTIEASALQNPGTLRVGVDASSYPFAGQSNGRMSGLDVDIAAALAQEMGLKVEYVDVGVDGLEALSGGDVDVVMGVEPSEADGACWTSDSYAPACIAMFSMKEGAKVPKKSKNPVIAAQTSSLSAWLVTRQYGNSALEADDELKTVFQDLDAGSVKYAAADAVVGSYVMNSLGIGGHIIGLMQQPDGYCVATASENTPLQLGITQALSTISGNGVLDVINTKWTGGTVDISAAALTESAQAEADKND
ncbi:MAG: transporter substrate-binding domain-containing protein [Coriobacteriaceae bacterium]|nr:transporter substrate-binding domain-containing protein [Coriobacteriaceae bacterium]